MIVEQMGYPVEKVRSVPEVGDRAPKAGASLLALRGRGFPVLLSPLEAGPRVQLRAEPRQGQWLGWWSRREPRSASTSPRGPGASPACTFLPHPPPTVSELRMGRGACLAPNYGVWSPELCVCSVVPPRSHPIVLGVSPRVATCSDGPEIVTENVANEDGSRGSAGR